MVQWIGLGVFSVGDCIPSLVAELGSRKPHSVAKGKKKKVMCVPHIFLESTVTDGSAERLSILPNVKRNKDMHSSTL